MATVLNWKKYAAITLNRCALMQIALQVQIALRATGVRIGYCDIGNGGRNLRPV